MKVRLSTTVDDDLLRQARLTAPGSTDASVVEHAFRSLLREHRRAEIDQAYAEAYRRHPIDEPDAWGDLVSFSDAARGR